MRISISISETIVLRLKMMECWFGSKGLHQVEESKHLMVSFTSGEKNGARDQTEPFQDISLSAPWYREVEEGVHGLSAIFTTELSVMASVRIEWN